MNVVCIIYLLKCLLVVGAWVQCVCDMLICLLYAVMHGIHPWVSHMLWM